MGGSLLPIAARIGKRVDDEDEFGSLIIARLLLTGKFNEAASMPDAMTAPQYPHRSLILSSQDFAMETDIQREQMFAAIEAGDIGIVHTLLKQGVDIELTRVPGESLLYQAAAANQEAIVKLLLERGADINASTWHDNQPIHAAAEQETPTILNILLAHGADAKGAFPNQNIHELPYDDLHHETPLHAAARCGRVENMAILLDHGADINATDSGENTPLHQAASEGHFEAVRFLLERGADAQACDMNNTTALFDAIFEQRMDIAHLLLEHGTRLGNPQTLAWHRLTYAAIHGNDAALESLLQDGVDINISNKGGDTALDTAIMFHNEIACSCLLRHGASTTNRRCHSPLLAAADKGLEGCVRLLLEYGADPNAEIPTLRTPLHAATYAGHTGTVRLLLAHGADTSKIDRTGKTALQAAEEKGDTDLVRLLRDMQ